MSEEIGKHKGAVETLLHEKKELSRLLQIVNSQLQRRLSALEDAGVDTDEFIKQIQEGQQEQQSKKKRGQSEHRNNRKQSKDRNKRRSSGQDSGRKRNRSGRDKRSRSSDDDDDEVDLGDQLEPGR